MQGSWIRKRTLAVAALAVAVAASVAFSAVPASAQPVTTGSLSFSGDPGDYISGGRSYAYSTTSGDSLTVGGDGNVISVSVSGANGDWWSLDLAAPSGQTLAPGTYAGATRYPFHGAGPGLSLSGNGRGCNQLTGTFTIQHIALGPRGYVQTVDATYEQHCEGGTAALRGEVHISNPPPPAELSLGLEVSTEGQANVINGRAYIKGTITCTAPAQVTISGLVTQVKHQILIRGNYSTRVQCTPNTTTPWTADADPTGTTPFQRGLAEVKANASAIDPVYHNTVSVDKTTIVRLKNSRPGSPDTEADADADAA